jgi:hypothetical protein
MSSLGTEGYTFAALPSRQTQSLTATIRNYNGPLQSIEDSRLNGHYLSHSPGRQASKHYTEATNLQRKTKENGDSSLLQILPQRAQAQAQSQAQYQAQVRAQVQRENIADTPR